MPGSTLVLVAAVFLAYAAVSRRLEGSWLTAPIVFVAAGFAFGEAGLGWLELATDEHGVSLLAEATLAVVLFSDASRIDLAALRREYSIPARLLGIGLPLTIAAGVVAGALVMPTVAIAEILVLAVVLAPTDAALGQAVVTDAGLPSRIRQGLNVESGLNDGICVPLPAIVIGIAEADADTTTGATAARLVVEAIGWGIAGGVVAGGVAGWVLLASRRRDWIGGHWAQVVPVVAAVGAYGFADARGGSGFIAAFVGGVVFGVIVRPEASTAAFAEEIGGVLNGLTLVVFGAAILGARWGHLDARDLVYAVLSLTLVRMVPVAIAMLGSGAKLPTVALLGWFGPRGLASIVFGVIVVESADLPHTERIVDALIVTVALSVLAHGVTAAPLVRRYEAWHDARRPAMESAPTPDQRWRHGPTL